MEQSFLLKYHIGLSLFEQATMTAEERNWWIQRIDKERKEENKIVEGNRSSIAMPKVPKIHIPHIPRP